MTLDSWNSEHHISNGVRDMSPNVTFFNSIIPPNGYDISFTTFANPPAPWS